MFIAAVSCGDLPSVQNAVTPPGAALYDSPAVYECIQGYRFHARYKKWKIFCDHHGNLQNVPPPCTSKYNHKPNIKYIFECIFNSYESHYPRPIYP